jgi:hypothetical protein
MGRQIGSRNRARVSLEPGTEAFKQDQERRERAREAVRRFRQKTQRKKASLGMRELLSAVKQQTHKAQSMATQLYQLASEEHRQRLLGYFAQIRAIQAGIETVGTAIEMVQALDGGSEAVGGARVRASLGSAAADQQSSE